tara:strand:- start:24 stop:437 length:414 start_codon:yes stop_codon:yes gene_type:complete
MIKFFRTYILLLIFLTSSPLHASSTDFKLKISDSTLNSFFNYISSKRKPLDRFLITTDGSGSFVWVCPQTLCFPAGKSFYSNPCSNLNNGKKCVVFAVGRNLKLSKNKFIPKSFKKFKRGDSLPEVKKKLKKLGFIE